jgi:uncharacterized protein (DUF1330 family)
MSNKGYWIASIDVTNPDGYKDYVAAVVEPFRKYRAKWIIRGSPPNVVEGTGRSRVVVIEFQDYATALACYQSPEYARAMDIRKRTASADVIVIEGYSGLQPEDLT